MLKKQPGAFKHVAVLLAMLSSRDINAKPPTMIRKHSEGILQAVHTKRTCVRVRSARLRVYIGCSTYPILNCEDRKAL